MTYCSGLEVDKYTGKQNMNTGISIKIELLQSANAY